MQHIALAVFGWLAAGVAVVALVAGQQEAAKIAGTGLGTIGITAGALVGGLDDLTSGFGAAKRAAEGPDRDDRPRGVRANG